MLPPKEIEQINLLTCSRPRVGTSQVVLEATERQLQNHEIFFFCRKFTQLHAPRVTKTFAINGEKYINRQERSKEKKQLLDPGKFSSFPEGLQD